MQDDYNRFIRHSIMQAQCNYEDIFQNDAQEPSCACAGSGMNGMTMGDAETPDACGCQGSMGTGAMPDACGCEVECRTKCDKDVPVMAFVEMQPFGRMYNEAEGLCRGTVFPALDKPFTGRGGCR